MTLPAHITTHSIERYKLRVENLPDDEVRARLSSPTIMAGVKLGTCSVKLPGHQRVIIVNGRIITVHPKPCARRSKNLGRREHQPDGRQGKWLTQDC